MGLSYSMSLPLIGGLVMWNIEEILFYKRKYNRLQGYNGKKKKTIIVPFGFRPDSLHFQMHTCQLLSVLWGDDPHNGLLWGS